MTPATERQPPKGGADFGTILCVDDEPQVLEGLALNLGRRYRVLKATSGAAGLEMLAKHPDIRVVISDMRMPFMDGAAFLGRARFVLPDAIRILLTGQAQLESAVAAVNEGQIFRFLMKPCPPATLIGAVVAASEQYRLITSERVLLEQTLHGSIKALTDVLALTSPLLFGRASRTKQRVSEIADQLGLQERWQVEVAAMLSQLGAIALPAETVMKVYRGEPLTEEDARMVERIPIVTEQLISGIPRLEVVRGILSLYSKPVIASASIPAGPHRDLIVRGAQILRVVVDFDALESQGSTAAQALDALMCRTGPYETDVLDALMNSPGLMTEGARVRDLPFADLAVGMILSEDVRLTTGVVLARRGYEVTAGFVERAHNYRQTVEKPSIRVVVPAVRETPENSERAGQPVSG